jgi:hypothetical protein
VRRITHTADFSRPKGLISVFSIGVYVSKIGKIGKLAVDSLFWVTRVKESGK